MAVTALPGPEPEPLNINLNDLTLGDLEDVEGIVGSEAIRLAFQGDVTPKTMVALVWVAKRTTNPAFTLDDARKMKLSVLSVDIQVDTSPKDGGN